MKRNPAILAAILSAMSAGCLGPAPKEPVRWFVEAGSATVKCDEAPRHGAARLSRLAVRPPYDRTALAVLRRNGSIAFDPSNSFAASPAAMLNGVALDVIAASGIFEAAVGRSSSAAAQESIEIDVNRFALDCRVQGLRTASVSLKVTLLKGHEILSVADGDGEASAAEGDYSASFSAAFTSALVQALRKL